jgi:hypothetical protein
MEGKDMKKENTLLGGKERPERKRTSEGKAKHKIIVKQILK